MYMSWTLSITPVCSYKNDKDTKNKQNKTNKQTEWCTSLTQKSLIKGSQASDRDTYNSPSQPRVPLLTKLPRLNCSFQTQILVFSSDTMDGVSYPGLTRYISYGDHPTKISKTRPSVKTSGSHLGLQTRECGWNVRRTTDVTRRNSPMLPQTKDFDLGLITCLVRMHPLST